ncbi:MAG TPA: PQQ-binding-like beta-propeller repeat protein [Firmicutes bacterium]|nr:PQQ-binding-like beta-propeller repeat protein [Candidatus Fermentithermobacillaceae bacterium]
MGVRLPLERRPSQGKPERPANDGRPRAYRDKDTRTGPNVRKALFLGTGALMLVAVGVLAGYFMGRVPPPSIIWEVGHAMRLCSGDAGFLLSTDSGLVLGTVGGGVIPVEMSAEQAILVGSSAVTARDGHLIAAAPGSPERPIAQASSDEFLLGAGNGCCYTARPKDGLSFGTNWLLRRVTLSGDTSWEATLTATPVICVETGDRVFIGSIDLPSGTLARLYAIHKPNGQLLWEREVGTGFWRDIFPKEDGTVLAVTGSSLTALSDLGHIRWTYQPPAPIAGAAEVGDSVALCYEPSGLTGKLMTPNVALVSSSGELLWVKAPAKRVVSVADWESADGSEPEQCVVALSETHVIALSQEDGRELWRTPAGGQPLELKGGFLLVRHGSGLRLVRPSRPKP